MDASAASHARLQQLRAQVRALQVCKGRAPSPAPPSPPTELQVASAALSASLDEERPRHAVTGADSSGSEHAPRREDRAAAPLTPSARPRGGCLALRLACTPPAASSESPFMPAQKRLHAAAASQPCAPPPPLTPAPRASPAPSSGDACERRDSDLRGSDASEPSPAQKRACHSLRRSLARLQLQSGAADAGDARRSAALLGRYPSAASLVSQASMATASSERSGSGAGRSDARGAASPPQPCPAAAAQPSPAPPGGGGAATRGGDVARRDRGAGDLLALLGSPQMSPGQPRTSREDGATARPAAAAARASADGDSPRAACPPAASELRLSAADERASCSSADASPRAASRTRQQHAGAASSSGGMDARAASPVSPARRSSGWRAPSAAADASLTASGSSLSSIAALENSGAAANSRVPLRSASGASQCGWQARCSAAPSSAAPRAALAERHSWRGDAAAAAPPYCLPPVDVSGSNAQSLAAASAAWLDRANASARQLSAHAARVLQAHSDIALGRLAVPPFARAPAPLAAAPECASTHPGPSPLVDDCTSLLDAALHVRSAPGNTVRGSLARSVLASEAAAPPSAMSCSDVWSVDTSTYRASGVSGRYGGAGFGVSAADVVRASQLHRERSQQQERSARQHAAMAAHLEVAEWR